METTLRNTAELMLELTLNDRSRRIFRVMTPEGEVKYVEVSDLIDFSRPLSEHAESYPVYESMASAWAATTRYLSAEGLLARSVWHEDLHEWADLTPRHIHAEMRPMVYADLSALINALTLEQMGRCPQVPTWLATVTEGRVAELEEQRMMAA